MAIALDNRDGAIELPRRGAALEVSLGFAETGVKTMSHYVVSEIDLHGPPLTIAVRGAAIDFRAEMKSQRTRSWDDTTLGAIVSDIARSHGLESRVEESLASVRVSHLDQVGESDMNLLTRLAIEHDALAKPGGGRLAVVPRGAGSTASGAPMPAIALAPSDVSGYRCTLAGRYEYRSVAARWRDSRGSTGIERAGSGEPASELRELYSDPIAARHAARARFSDLARETRRFVATLCLGNPDAVAGASLVTAEFGSGVDGEWVVVRATHRITRRDGYVTSLEARPVTPRSPEAA